MNRIELFSYTGLNNISQQEVPVSQKLKKHKKQINNLRFIATLVSNIHFTAENNILYWTILKLCLNLSPVESLDQVDFNLMTLIHVFLYLDPYLSNGFKNQKFVNTLRTVQLNKPYVSVFWPLVGAAVWNFAFALLYVATPQKSPQVETQQLVMPA